MMSVSDKRTSLPTHDTTNSNPNLTNTNAREIEVKASRASRLRNTFRFGKLNVKKIRATGFDYL